MRARVYLWKSLQAALDLGLAFGLLISRQSVRLSRSFRGRSCPIVAIVIIVAVVVVILCWLCLFSPWFTHSCHFD